MSAQHAEAWEHLPSHGKTSSPNRYEIELHNSSNNFMIDDEIRFETPFLNSSLQWQSMPAYNAGNAPLPPTREEKQRILFRTMVLTLGILFTSVMGVVTILWVSLPPMREEDRAYIHMPKSVHDLKELVKVLGHYSEEHYYRVMIVWLTVFLFIQTFSIPGSMYMCIIAGAMWGVPVSLPIVCTSIATGATFCYLISQQLGACIRVVPRWQQRVDAWKITVQQYQSNLLSYLTILRMMPVPPHFVVNIIAPHLGIPVRTFWISTLSGVFCSSLIYTALGEELDQITMSDSFHVLSWRNILLFTVVVLACILPMCLKGRVQAPEQRPGQLGMVRLEDELDWRAHMSWQSRLHCMYMSLLALIHPALRTRQQPIFNEVDEDAFVDEDPMTSEATAAWQDHAAMRASHRPLASMPPMESEHTAP